MPPGASSRLQPPPPEFKKPQQQNNGRPPSHHPHQRGVFVKPTDGKPPYEGRGGYPGQPGNKHANNPSNHRSNGILPPKGPPPLNSSAAGSAGNSTSPLPSSISRMYATKNLPRLSIDQVSDYLYKYSFNVL